LRRRTTAILGGQVTRLVYGHTILDGTPQHMPLQSVKKFKEYMSLLISTQIPDNPAWYQYWISVLQRSSSAAARMAVGWSALLGHDDGPRQMH